MKLFSFSSANDRGSFAKRFEQANGLELIVNALAAFSVVSLLLGIELWFALVAAGISLALIVSFGMPAFRRGRRWRQYLGRFVLARVLIVFAIGYAYLRTSDDLLVWVSVGVFVFLIGTEVNAAKVSGGAIPYAVNLPGISARNSAILRSNSVFAFNMVVLVAYAALAWFGVNPWVGLVLVCLSAIPTVILIGDGIFRVRGRRIAERGLSHALTAHAPQFAVHWDAREGSEYQLAMWLPYLERLNVPFIVIVRSRSGFDSISPLTSAPVLLRRAVADIDAVITPSLKAVFYVNLNAPNVHIARFSHLNHIQLNHGESDKAPSYNPVLRMFDKNFVAGQAAIDRFERAGIAVAPDFFSIVGRPQVENIQVVSEPSPVQQPTVMYAPTWAGYFSDSNYSSLVIGFDIVSALLRRGVRVIYRSHPYTSFDKKNAFESERIVNLLREDAAESGRDHLWGAAAEKDLTTTECFNLSDALISDVSSIVPDFLYSEKPFAITAILPSEDFEKDFPLAAAAYVVKRDASNVESVLDSLLNHDELRTKRLESKRYYMGDFPAENYSEAFFAEARKFIEA